MIVFDFGDIQAQLLELERDDRVSDVHRKQVVALVGTMLLA